MAGSEAIDIKLLLEKSKIRMLNYCLVKMNKMISRGIINKNSIIISQQPWISRLMRKLSKIFAPSMLK